MPLGAHPRFRWLRSELARLQRRSGWRGECYRVAETRWASTNDVFSGEGARQVGGRWSPPGIRAAYASTDPELALSEWLTHARRMAIPPSQRLPAVIAWGDVRLKDVLDLTGDVLEWLRLDRAELLSLDWSSENRAGRECLPQAAGRAARACGVEALLVPSAASSGTNLVLFPDALLPGSRIVAHGLKPGPRS